jgi:hypothetical protein
MTDAPRRLASLADLPQEVPPDRDLWPAIAARIATEPRAAAPGEGADDVPVASAAPAALGGRSPRVRRPPGYAWALAATVAALAVGVWIGRSAGPAPTIAVTTPATNPAATPAAAPAAAPSIDGTGLPAAANALAAFSPDARYQLARRQLLEQSRARIAALPPEARQRVAESLELLQRSIADIRDALGRDPANVLLQELLMNAYQDEMRVLVTVDEAGATGKEI